MTTHTDILKPKCCCIRHDPMYPPQLMLLENLLMLIVFITLHFTTFLLGWTNVCLGTLLGIYYGMYQVAVIYCYVNKCYINSTHSHKDDSDSEDEGDADDEAETEGVVETEADTETETEVETKGEAEDEAEDEYADMPPLINMYNEEYIYTPLQPVVDDTRTSDIAKQIKDTLKNLQEMIEIAKERAQAQTDCPELIPEFKKED